MIEAYRVVQHQLLSYSYEATGNADEAAYLESVLEFTKPKVVYADWHRLIGAPFRYSLPVQPMYQARFSPPYSNRNALYCSEEPGTALYEHAYHFLKQRVHLAGAVPETDTRTIFSLFIKKTDIEDIRRRKDIARITDRQDYTASHEFIRKNPALKVVAYPSCRDPERGRNFAAFEIASLGKEIGKEQVLSFYFDPERASIRWIDYTLDIDWKVVG